MTQVNYYPIVDITNINQEYIEYLGTKHKFWFENNNDRFLFKSIKVERNGETQLRIGEDCSEKIACEIAKLLCIPHVEYDLANYGGLRGVISKNFISNDKGEQLVSGNELLEKSTSQSNDEQQQNVHQRIEHVYFVMENLINKKPLGFNALSNIKKAGEFFLGYLMLDALISNQDRHNENWGMIQTVKGSSHLALTFDHGASLGKNIGDAEKLERLNTSDSGRSVGKYTSRAKSWFYASNEQSSRLKVMDAFVQFGRYYPESYRAWIRRLNKIDDKAFESIIRKIPEHLMSEISKQFAFEMIKCNKLTIIDKFDKYAPPNIPFAELIE